MTTLRCSAEDYLVLRRSLGFKLDTQGRLLLDFVGHAEAASASHVTIELALAWATLPVDASPVWYWNRLCAVRGFAVYAHAIDPRHQVPPADLLPRRYSRAAPYLFTDADVTALMLAAGTLSGRLRSATYQTLIGLLGVTGMRPGESYQLDRDRVNLHDAVITVADAKYGKVRELAVQPSTIDALAEYAALRDHLCPRPTAPSFFVSTTGARLLAATVENVFAQLARQVGLHPLSPRCGPCPKSLRHSFAVNTLIGWYHAGVDIDAHLPLLSTWLGHVNPASTYWYLQATPELLALAATRLKQPPENQP